MKIRIHVTKDVLKESMHCPLSRHIGWKDETAFDFLKENCAVSLAIRDLFPKAKTYQACVLLDGTFKTRVHFELRVMKYVKAFDDVYTYEERLQLPEMSFEIIVPDEIINQIGIHEVDRILSESKTLEKA